MILESNSDETRIKRCSLVSPKLNLLIISDDPCVGGVARHADILCRGLTKDIYFSENWAITHAIAMPLSKRAHP